MRGEEERASAGEALTVAGQAGCVSVTSRTPQPVVKALHPPCPYCHGPVEPRQIKAACDGCMAWHHRECWEEHGACAACAFPDPPLCAPEMDLSSGDLDPVRDELRLGTPGAAQGLCLDLRSGDERAARRLYEALLREARERGWIESAQRQNARVLDLLASGEPREAQALCLKIAGEDEDRARRLYESLLDRANQRGLIPPRKPGK